MTIQFPAFRRFEATRVSVNDAFVGLVTATKIAIDHLPPESDPDASRYLPDLYSHLDGMGRLNRTTVDAAEVFLSTERHIAYMAIPYVIAGYETLLVEALQLLEEDGVELDLDGSIQSLGVKTMHEVLAERCALRLPEVELNTFDIARRIRNRIVHNGGTAGSRLREVYQGSGRALWEGLAGRPLPIGSRRTVPMPLGVPEVTPVLAVTKRLSKAIAGELGRALNRATWTRIVVLDYASHLEGRLPRGATTLRKVAGHARFYYGDLRLTDEELLPAIEEVWTGQGPPA